MALTTRPSQAAGSLTCPKQSVGLGEGGIDQVLHAETAYDLHATSGARSESGLLTHGGGHGA
jgi:hypothetical protein